MSKRSPILPAPARKQLYSSSRNPASSRDWHGRFVMIPPAAKAADVIFDRYDSSTWCARRLSLQALPPKPIRQPVHFTEPKDFAAGYDPCAVSERRGVGCLLSNIFRLCVCDLRCGHSFFKPLPLRETKAIMPFWPVPVDVQLDVVVRLDGFCGWSLCWR